MTGLAPLLFLWLWTQRRDSTPQPPMWPTAASPPPPMPAFSTTPGQPSADTGTPLAQLSQPQPEPSHPADPSKPKSAAAAAAAAAKSAAIRAARKKLTAALTTKKSTPQKSVSVSALQKAMISRGVNVKPDGLYGPKTAAAWSALAKQKGLPPTISRVGPKVARVATQTFDALSVPAIP